MTPSTPASRNVEIDGTAYLVLETYGLRTSGKSRPAKPEALPRSSVRDGARDAPVPRVSGHLDLPVADLLSAAA
jgi:hypothetical protein